MIKIYSFIILCWCCIHANAQWSVVRSGTYPGTTSTVTALCVYNDTLYVTGQSFDLLATDYISSSPGLGKWDGSNWHGVSQGLKTTGGSILAMQVYQNNLYIGGNFFPFMATGGAVVDTGIAQMNNAGVWSSVGISGGNAQVNSFAVENNILYVGGIFVTSIGGVYTQSPARWNGSTWSAAPTEGGPCTSQCDGCYPPPPGVTNYAMVADTVNNIIYLGGGGIASVCILNASSNLLNGVVSWNGSDWSPLGTGMGPFGTTGNIVAMCMYQGNLYVGGQLKIAGGDFVTAIAMWNGSSWSSVGTGSGLAYSLGQPEVKAMIVYNGNLIVGGKFSSINGISVPGIAQWNGTNWSAVGTGVSNPDYTAPCGFAIYKNSLYVGGIIYTIGSSTAYGVAKYTESATGIGDLADDHLFAIYPNPTSGIINIQSENSEGNKIEIFNVMGQEVYASTINNQSTLDISDNSDGVYFINIHTGDRTLYQKIILQK